jgi:hypothetical protein
VKIRAWLKRDKMMDGRRSLRCTFPAERQWPYVIPESVLARNLGPRPYGEGFFTNDQGQKVVVYFASR